MDSAPKGKVYGRKNVVTRLTAGFEYNLAEEVPDEWSRGNPLTVDWQPLEYEPELVMSVTVPPHANGKKSYSAKHVFAQAYPSDLLGWEDRDMVMHFPVR